LGYTEGRSLRYAGGEFLEHPALGELIVDLVYDERVEGCVRVLGIEYLARVLARGGEDQSGEGLQHTGFVIGEYEEEPEEPDEEPCPHLRIVHVASTQRPTR